MRSSPWILIVVLSLMAWLAPGAPAQGTPPGDRPLEIPSDYKLGPEDVISVVTRDVPELSGDFLIRLDGKFTMPIIGDVEAAGLTVTELKYRLEQALRRELREPQVTVNVKQMRLNRVYVLGAVGRPSIIDYRPGWRLTEAIAAVGGLANLPERLRALVIRGGKTTVVELREIFIDGKNESNLLLQPGDVISIQSDATIRVNILGPVGRPGLVTILEGQGIVEALAAAGGESERAALTKAKVVRRGQEIPVDLYAAVKKGRTELNLKLEDNDTIIIPEVTARIAVVGQVKQSGAQVIPDGREWTLSQAISNAGGPAPGAKTDGVTIIRQTPEGKVERININYRDIIANKPGAVDPVLQDRDVVFVPQSGKAGTGEISSVLGLVFWPLRLLGF